MGYPADSLTGSVRRQDRGSRDTELRTIDDVEAAVSSLITPDVVSTDLFGIEIEGFPIRVDASGPIGRVSLSGGNPSVLGVVDDLAEADSTITARTDARPRHETSTGGTVTYEPGGQIEFSSSPSESAAGAVEQAFLVWNQLSDAFWQHDICLVSLGTDPWTKAGAVAQQLTAARYRAMAKYFATRGEHGAVMMRNTCSLQVNLDQGGGLKRDERWLVANLISPVLTAMFASSPAPGLQSARARAWQQLDPTRTGFPRWSSTYSADLITDTVKRALTADVIYAIREGHTVVGRPGWSFRDWLDDGHPEIGRPTHADLEIHLTTLFTEVRARSGTFELRGIDAVPQRWWETPLTIAGATLYDARAAGRVIDLLEGWAPRLHGMWLSAATEGLRNPELGKAAEEVATIAMDSARRNWHLFGESAIKATEDFLDRYTFRALSPADDLADKLDRPRAAIEWAVPQHALIGAA